MKKYDEYSMGVIFFEFTSVELRGERNKEKKINPENVQQGPYDD